MTQQAWDEAQKVIEETLGDANAPREQKLLAAVALMLMPIGTRIGHVEDAVKFLAATVNTASQAMQMRRP